MPPRQHTSPYYPSRLYFVPDDSPLMGDSEKQYKTRICLWGLKKYNKDTLPLLYSTRANRRKHSTPSDPVVVENETPTSFESLSSYRCSDVFQGHQQPCSSYENYWPSRSTLSDWSSIPLGDSHRALLEMQDQNPYYNAMAQSTPYTAYRRTNVKELLDMAEISWRNGELFSEGISTIMSVVDFFTAARCYDVAYKLGQEILLRIVKTTIEYRLPAVALIVIKNARCLLEAKKISALMSMVTCWVPGQGAIFETEWCLLRSVFGLILLDLGDFPAAFNVCHSAVQRTESQLSSQFLNCEYLILIMNLHKVCKLRCKVYHAPTVWRKYLNMMDSGVLTQINQSLVSILKWCVSMLENGNLWKVFEDADETPWRASSSVTAMDLAEFEARVLFCHLWRLHSSSPAASVFLSHSGNWESPFLTLSRFCSMKSMDVLATLTRMIMLTQVDHPGSKHKSNLPRRAIRAISMIAHFRSSLHIHEGVSWDGPPLTAAFLETFALLQCNSYRSSNGRFNEVVDAFVRDFGDQNFGVDVSNDALEGMQYLHTPPGDAIEAMASHSSSASNMRHDANGNVPGRTHDPSLEMFTAFETLAGGRATLRQMPLTLYELLASEKM